MSNLKHRSRVSGFSFEISKKRVLLATSALIACSAFAGAAAAQDNDADDDIVVTGIRSSLESALNEKRNADSLVEVIKAEDIGKLPDQNLAEVLENVTGIQITRTAGVGTGVQIRGTNDNRVEINGVSTVGSGTGRGGINFEDINAAIIAAVEVTKAPESKTIEGSVGGTINLRTIRPLELTGPLIAVRAQGEYSELSETVRPRIAGSFGNNWETGLGEVGLVLSGSWTQQEATSFRPRVDRDTLISTGSVVTAAGDPGPDFPFLGIQFLNQELENFEFDTINFAGTLEWAPTENLSFFFDTIYNDQERRQDSSRVQGSGVSSLRFNNVPSTFETVDFGSLDGADFGSIQAALTGTIQPNLAVDDDDPNLRFSSDVGARLTTSEIYRLGGDYQSGRFSAHLEGSMSVSNTFSPDLSTTLNFINPNALTPLDGSSNDNSVPFIYDLSGGALTFGVDFNSPFAPTVQDLLNPNNTVLDAVTVGRNTTRNSEDAFRFDTSYDFVDILPIVTSIDLGYRFNNTENEFNQVRSTFGTGSIANSPSGSLFADLLVPGPSNFGEFDGRELAFRNFLLVDPDRAFSDADGTLDILQAALATTSGSVSDPSPQPQGSFAVDETTHAIYGQANFEVGILRGNFGIRYIDTSIDTFGNSVASGVATPISANNSYSEILPRFNLIADLSESLVLRASWGEDINRPDFNNLSLSVNFPTGPNNAVRIGNPNLTPETVTSYDASVDWYFAPASVFSVGFFHKVRSGVFVNQLEDVAIDANGFRDITPPCEGGGIFNPLPDRNVLSDIPGNGLCVPILTVVNDTANTTQTGVEVAFQYDLSQFEDRLGFASGFGFLGNYTYQDFGGGELTNSASSRGGDIFEASSGRAGPFVAVQGLLDFSNHAYNATVYYEKYGISARARYTWRDSFRTLDTAGGATLNSTLGFPTVTESRGQLNASINYDVTERFNIGVEAVNLTKSKITQSCVNEGALLCFQGLPDRRITFGGSFKF